MWSVCTFVRVCMHVWRGALVSGEALRQQEVGTYHDALHSNSVFI